MRRSFKMIVVAPYLGEFGWELMNWQGRVRRLISETDGDRVIVCGESDRRALYAQPDEDGRFVFCPIVKPDLPGHRNEDHRIDDHGQPVDREVLRGRITALAREACESIGLAFDEDDLLMPDMASTLYPTTRPHQLFEELRIRSAIDVDVVLAPRVRRMAGERNMGRDWWEAAARQLRQAGLTVQTYEPRLDAAIRQLSRARLAIGASTGGLHLASLCRCPHYVWGAGADQRWTRLGISNRQRYETFWNPFGTPCRYDECGWQPSVEHVVRQTLQALDEIGLPKGSAAPSWSLRPGWRIKRGLARLMEEPAARGWCPWRVRELIREHLV